MEDVHTRRRIFLSLAKPGCGLQEFNSRKFHLHLTILTIFGETRIHLNSDVFAAAVVDATAP